MTGAPILRASGISKSFGPTRALDDVSIDVRQREILGLIGENGAGKSTLLNVLSGVVAPDAGQLEIGGERRHLRNYQEATRAGLFRVFQELSLVPNLSVAENLVLGHERRFEVRGVISRRRVDAYAREALASFDHGWIDPATTTGELDFATRQVLETIRAIALARLLEVEHPVVMFDEATAGLPRTEVAFFLDLVRGLRERGAAVVFVSHRLGELIDVSDRIVVLKDGQVVARPDRAIDQPRLHALMTGRTRDEAVYREHRQRVPDDEILLACRGVHGEGFGPVDLEVRSGEITGIAGVIGSGKSSLLRAIFSGRGLAGGTVEVGGAAVAGRNARAMVRAGVGYVSPDRQAEGILADLSIAWNVTLARIAEGRDRGVLRPRADRELAHRMMRELRIKAPNPSSTPRVLSGGNQQKVVIARWLACETRLLLLDNPTKGIDVGAKEELYDLLRDFTDRGGAVVLVSDELVELIGLSNRVVVMRDGAITHEAAADPGAKPEESALVGHMV